MVVLSQRKGHVCLLFYTTAKLSGIKNGCSFSSPLTADISYHGPVQSPLGAGAAGGSQRAMALQRWARVGASRSPRQICPSNGLETSVSFFI